MVVVQLLGDDNGKYEVYYGDKKMDDLDGGVFAIDLAEEVTEEVAKGNVEFKAVK
ncbi:hypothetical protein [Clostridium tetani]|nr:hypothetical protein [Clostridium tetani]